MNSILSISHSRRPPSWSRKLVGRSVPKISLCILYTLPVSLQLPLAPFTDFLLFFSQVATDKCIMAFLFLIVIGVIAIIIVKVPDTSQFLSYSNNINICIYRNTCIVLSSVFSCKFVSSMIVNIISLLRSSLLSFLS